MPSVSALLAPTPSLFHLHFAWLSLQGLRLGVAESVSGRSLTPPQQVGTAHVDKIPRLARERKLFLSIRADFFISAGQRVVLFRA